MPKPSKGGVASSQEQTNFEACQREACDSDPSRPVVAGAKEIKEPRVRDKLTLSDALRHSQVVLQDTG
jgi:hypothetical protein